MTLYEFNASGRNQVKITQLLSTCRNRIEVLYNEFPRLRAKCPRYRTLKKSLQGETFFSA